MASTFNFANFGAIIANAKDKAIAVAGEYGLNDIVGGHVLPPIPPFPKGDPVGFESADFGNLDLIEQQEIAQEYSIFGTPMCFPLKVKSKNSSDDFWLIPVEPIITLSGSNTIAKRKVAKMAKGNGRGTVKERWAQDDYNISIDGLLTRFDEWKYPTQDVVKMMQICESSDPILVQCPLFEIFSIKQITIENFDFPFTKGPENQAYRISALSDDDWPLLIPKKSINT